MASVIQTGVIVVEMWNIALCTSACSDPLHSASVTPFEISKKNENKRDKNGELVGVGNLLFVAVATGCCGCSYHADVHLPI